MIAYLARHSIGRIALIPVVQAVGAYSWWTIDNGTTNEQDRGRTLHLWGWLDPRLDPEWARFEGTDSRYHLLKNMGSEWVKLDPQRAYKAGCFILACAIILAAAASVGVTVLL